MKNQFIITVAFLAVTSFTNQIFAQQPAAKSADWDLAKGKESLSCSVTTTDEGCSFNFTKIDTEYRDSSSGLPTGKRQHKPFTATFEVSSSDNSVTQIVSPRDAASGLPTGKRMHKPLVITKELDKSSPMLAKKTSDTDESTARGSGRANVQDISMKSVQGSGKVSVQDFHFTMKGNGKSTIIRCPDGSCVIPTDCPDGQYTLMCDWSWGASQTGTKRCAAEFALDIENGACMAINSKGTGASNK